MQYRGITPGGPMDRFSCMEGNVLAGNDFYSPCLEIIMAPVIKFNVSGIFVLTGAPLKGSLPERGGKLWGLSIGLFIKLRLVIL
jgi:allophanate hydrolase subunit 2